MTVPMPMCWLAFFTLRDCDAAKGPTAGIQHDRRRGHSRGTPSELVGDAVVDRPQLLVRLHHWRVPGKCWRSGEIGRRSGHASAVWGDRDVPGTTHSFIDERYC